MKKVFDDTMALKLMQVYPDEYIKWLGIGYTGGGGMRKRRQKCNAILMCALNYILNNIILYDRYYKAPFRGKGYFIMCMTAKGRKEVAYILKTKPLYRYVDLVQTKGVIYQIGMYFPMLPKGKRKVRVHVGKKHWYAIEAMGNSGKTYSILNHQTTTIDVITNRELIEHVCKYFPEETEKTIRRCVIYGMKRIGYFNANGHGVSFSSAPTKFCFRSYYYKKITRAMSEKQYALMVNSQKAKKQGVKSKHQKLKDRLTWLRTKTSLKKGSSLVSTPGYKRETQPA